jgi:TRAP-type C4-dicarboxylate transport system permease large subunit
MNNVSTSLPYIIGGICFAVFFLLAFVSANMVNYRTDHSDKSTRRVWFWVFAALTAISTFCICYFGFAIGIKMPSKQGAFLNSTCIATGVFLVAYIILGLVVSKIFKSKKVQSWF